MAKVLSPTAVVALKEALCTIYWFKDDLKTFLYQCVQQHDLLARLNWGAYKRQVVSDLVDALCNRSQDGLSDLTRLCYAVCGLETFSHLEQIEDGKQKAQRAKVAVAQLRALLEPHQDAQQQADEIAERQRRNAEKLKASAAMRQKLEEIRSCYMALVTSKDVQGRGYALESVLEELFELFDLDPKASFKIVGEQIDGAFSLDGTEYLLEGRWRKETAAAADLDAFAAKVSRKLDNTLGLFLSIAGFSEDGVQAHSKGRPSIILMHGADLMAVLEERIDFVGLLLRKKRHAAATGSIYLPISEIEP